MIKEIEDARLKYKPKKIKFLLVAEAPPKVESKRFFYFEDISDGDSLFLETMKVLYPAEYLSTSDVRLNKKKFLEKFRDDGFYLLDASDEPMHDNTPYRKQKQIEKALPTLRKKIWQLISPETNIILISATVYNTVYRKLKEEGFNLINEEMIEFPGSGGQKRFRVKLSRLLNDHGFRISFEEV